VDYASGGRFRIKPHPGRAHPEVSSPLDSPPAGFSTVCGRPSLPGRPGARRFLSAALDLCPESSFYRARAQTMNPRAVHP